MILIQIVHLVHYYINDTYSNSTFSTLLINDTYSNSTFSTLLINILIQIVHLQYITNK